MSTVTPATRREARASEGARRAPEPPAASGRTLPQLVGLAVGGALLLLALGLAGLVVLVPLATGSQALTVLTGSMQPTLPPGTLVVVRPTDVDEIRVGDVITFQPISGDPTLVTHRVTARGVASDGTVRFTTQGDANDVADAAQITDEQVMGRVWYSVPLVGWVNDLLSGTTRLWLVPIVVGCLFLYGGWNVAAWFRDRRRRARRTAETGERRRHRLTA
jgi:signal peptidase I